MLHFDWILVFCGEDPSSSYSFYQYMLFYRFC